MFTDLHCGLAGNRQSRLNICVKVVDEIRDAAEKNGVKNIVFGGDWFHSRSTLDVNTINVALGLVEKLASVADVYLICGNHDAFLKNSTDINSLNMFRSMKNVFVVDKPEEADLNGQRCLFVPWLTDLSVYGKSSFDVMIGHFEISSKYLIQSYIEDNSLRKAVGAEAAKAIEGDELLKGGAKRKSDDLLGNFVDLVKRGGRIYAGHIHNHKETTVKGRWFSFVGSPYQQTLGEIDSASGYYVLDEGNRPEFFETKSAPKHVQIEMSKAVSGKFDFGLVTGNIVQKIYDADVSPKDDQAVNKKINDFKPYEELLPDYLVEVGRGAGEEASAEAIELIRKSKLEYIRNYVDGIDQLALDEQGIDRKRLFSVLESYYRKVVED